MLQTKAATTYYATAEEVVHIAEKIIKERIEQTITNGLQNLMEEMTQLLDKRWVFFDNKHVFFDREVVGLYPHPHHNELLATTWLVVNQVDRDYLRFEGFTGELPSYHEIFTSFNKDVSSPIKPVNEAFVCALEKTATSIAYGHDNKLRHFFVNTNDTGHSSGQYKTIFPIFRFKERDASPISVGETMALFIEHGLRPTGLSKEAHAFYEEISNSLAYVTIDATMINIDSKQLFEDVVKGTCTSFANIDLNKEAIHRALTSEDAPFKIDMDIVKDRLLHCEEVRADIEPYDDKLLTDPNRGHWDLWPLHDTEGLYELQLHDGFVMRDPRAAIKKDGIIGIDFGTKSTVVVHQESQEFTLPMRIGIGKLSKQVEAHHYENPTMMEFVNLDAFMAAYEAKAGRPSTKWQDVRISHTAKNSLNDTLRNDQYYTVLSDLKQWAGDKKRQIRLQDQQGEEFVLPSFLDLSEDNINPIELYAYYIGLYINNMHNGIYLDYALSFPVTYEKEVRAKIIESFEAGLKKSLPLALLQDEAVMADFRVVSGASEPAAYAVCALQQYELHIEEDEQIFYGVFDFGGGTTDFDFGIWRQAEGKETRRYDYVIEHFGAGGDKYLGGENILELLAFHVFKQNEDVLRQAEIVFMLPPECQKFAGSEVLLSDAQEAKLNMRRLMEALRPLWEQHTGYEQAFDRGLLRLALYTRNGDVEDNFELTIDREKLEEIIEARVERGVRNFFLSLQQALTHELAAGIEEVTVLLSGNSSKAAIVEALFDKYIEQMDVDVEIDLLPPLGTEAADAILVGEQVLDAQLMTRPTGKTGVAFGLVMSRKGGRIKVIDHNVVEDAEVHFKYYVGENRRNQFKSLLDRTTGYNAWVELIDAQEEDFELYYTTLPEAQTNTLAIQNVLRKKCRLVQTFEQGNVYIRAVAPTIIEYVVATEVGIQEDVYLSAVTKLELA